jgi:uracil-DNA glycosylase family 4
MADFQDLCARVRDCFACPNMNHVHILGDVNGPLDADVLFLAEAPGRLGAVRTGVPMTSDVTGRRFHAFLADAGIARERVFVTNSVLCHPRAPNGNNRRPSTKELAACTDFLAAQVELVAAPFIVTLGGVALDALWRISPHKVVLAHDVARQVRWTPTTGQTRLLVPLYHPSIQSTLTRPHEAQRRDWQRLGELVRGALSSSAQQFSACRDPFAPPFTTAYDDLA